MHAFGHHLNKVLAGVLLASALGGCSLREETATGPAPAGPQLLSGTVALGPISGAAVSLFALDGVQVGQSSTTTLFDPAVDTVTYGAAAGMRLASRTTEGRKVAAFMLSNAVRAFQDTDLVVVQVDGGVDIDPNDDGVIGPTEGVAGPALQGSLYAVAYYGDLRNGLVVVNPLTSMAYAGVMNMSDPAAVALALDSFSRYLFKDGAAGDVNQDGVIDLRDLYSFDPTAHTLAANGPQRDHDPYLRRLANFTDLLPDADPTTTTFIESLHAGARAAAVATYLNSRYGSFQGQLNPFVDLQTVDIDGDGLVGAADLDSDNDSLPDSYELSLGLNMWLSDVGVDDDADGLDNIAEYNGGVASTDPFNPDTDGDTISDGAERNWGLNPLVKNTGDSDNDSLSDVVEVARNSDPLDINSPSTDIDGDGLNNDFELSFGYDHLDINSPSTDVDGDGLSNNIELAWGLDPLVANIGDTDGDGLNDSVEIVGTVITINGAPRTVTSDPLLVDTDGDGLSDGLEVTGYTLYDRTTLTHSDPQLVDSDGDAIDDAAEKGVNDKFAIYPTVSGTVASFLAEFKPNQRTNLNLDGLHITNSATTITGTGMEDDPDGDGKPTIEELFHATLPNTLSSTFNYISEADPSVWNAMSQARFRYIPGGFDVDGDGLIEQGFWMAQFEARPNLSPVALKPVNPAELFAGSSNYLNTGRVVDGAGVYLGDPDANGLFDNNGSYAGVLCNALTGTAIKNRLVTPNCIPNQLVTSWPASMNYATYSVNFDPTGTPYQTNVSWVDARMAVLDPDSAIPNGKPIDLPTEKQWAQLMQLVVNEPNNWTSGQLHGGNGAIGINGHKLMRGNVSGGSVLRVTLDPDVAANGYDGTAYSNNNNGFYDPGEEMRRTHIVRNSVIARDFNLPANYQAVLWDLSGNLWEWSRELAFVDDNLSVGVGSGLPISYSATTPDRLSSWLKPNRATGTVLSGAGNLTDAGPTITSRIPFVSLTTLADQISSVLRGGCLSCGADAGIASLSLEYGPGGALSGDNRFGFRAASR